MDGEALLEAIRTATETERSRLGSEKVLLAATDASLEAEPIAAALLADLNTAHDRLDRWAEAADPGPLADAMAEGAARIAARRATVAETWPGADPDGAAGLLGDLDEPDGAAARAGAGLLAIPLVLDGLLLQAVSYHVNEANQTEADVWRDVRSEVAAAVTADAESLAAADVDGEAVVAGAVGAIEAVYATYAARLEAMGLDPKPIC